MKEQLAQFIEAYAAARPTGNAMLQQFAARELGTFLESIDVIAKPTLEVVDDGSKE